MHEHLLWDIRTPKMQADPDQGPDENVVSPMRSRGFSEDEIELITIRTPKRLLTFV